MSNILPHASPSARSSCLPPHRRPLAPSIETASAGPVLCGTGIKRILHLAGQTKATTWPANQPASLPLRSSSSSAGLPSCAARPAATPFDGHSKCLGPLWAIRIRRRTGVVGGENPPSALHIHGPPFELRQPVFVLLSSLLLLLLSPAWLLSERAIARRVATKVIMPRGASRDDRTPIGSPSCAGI